MKNRTIHTVSKKIFANYPNLSAGKKNDILVLLEEFEKRYGRDFFSEKLNLVNAMRITGLKYITARAVLMDLVKENVNDVLILQPLLEMQEAVFKKIDMLHNIKGRFPDYPNHGLSKLAEWLLIQEIADLNYTNQFQILAGQPISEILISNPKVFHHFF